jgi:hypothetical protein
VRYKGGGESFDGESELTERIAPGKIDPATIRLDELNELPAGSYKLEICADVSEAVNESNERDNCAKVKGSRFYSTYRDWAGSVGGIGWGIGGPAFSGITETWRSADTGIDVVYTFSKYSGAGQFLWIYQGGAVKYTHQGSLGPGCENVYGSATFVLDPGAEVTTDYEKGSYTAKASAITGATYPITSSCGFGGQGPVHGAVLSTGSQSLPFDTQRLAGAAASDVDPGVNYTWDLAGR